ncbi:MAG: hypothetical protein ACUVSX_04850 [Aggregatilineales bacterium]
MSRLVFVLAITAALAACEPAPTPFPAAPLALPSKNPLTEDAHTRSEVRYALGASAAALANEPPFRSRSVAVLEGTPDPALLGERYDIAADFGLFAGATAAPLAACVSLVINTALAPLDAAPVAEVVRSAAVSTDTLSAAPGAQSLATPAPSLAALRTQLANAGWPDGFNVAAAAPPVPGVDRVLAALSALGIEIRPALTAFISPETWGEDRLHLGLIVWHAAETRERWAALAGADNVVDLYTLPFGYIAAPDLELVFTPEGWPLPAAWQLPEN